MGDSNPDCYHSPITFLVVQHETPKAYKLLLTSPVDMTIWLPKSIIRHFDEDAGTAMAHSKILLQCIEKAEAYYQLRYGQMAGELPNTEGLKTLKGRRCRSCPDSATPGHKHCRVCHAKWRTKRAEKQARTAAQPKCRCGSCLSLDRVQRGMNRCPTCEEMNQVPEVDYA